MCDEICLESTKEIGALEMKEREGKFVLFIGFGVSSWRTDQLKTDLIIHILTSNIHLYH